MISAQRVRHPHVLIGTWTDPRRLCATMGRLCGPSCLAEGASRVGQGRTRTRERDRPPSRPVVARNPGAAVPRSRGIPPARKPVTLQPSATPRPEQGRLALSRGAWYRCRMGMDAAEQAELRAIIAAALHGGLTEPMARRMYAMGSEATTSVALAVNARMRQLTGVGLSPGPHTPSA